MKFSWQSINYLIELKDIKLEKLANQLTLAGFEVDNIVKTDKTNDEVFDVDITANRQDTTHVMGLAKEIGCILNKPLKKKKNIVYKKDNIHLNHVLNCSKSILNIAIQNITNIKIVATPTWLTNYLISYDIQPSNTLDNIIQYINIKWGQDISILDLQEISRENFDIKYVTFEKRNKISSIDESISNITYEVLRYRKHIILANETDIHRQYRHKPYSSSIVVLGAICNYTYTKNNRKKHFKEISRDDFVNAYRETIELIIELTKGQPGTEYSYHQAKPKHIINLKKNLIHNILGPIDTGDTSYNTYMSTNTIFGILQQLKFYPKYNNNNFTVTIPDHRQNDIQRPIDVVEEIGRIYGFDKFKDNLPINTKTGYIGFKTKKTHKIRDTLRNLGLHEIINYSLEEIGEEKYIALQNPLLQDQAQLRSNLTTNLINTKYQNIKQKNNPIEGFEIGKIFYKEKNGSIIEKENIAGILGNADFARHSWLSPAQELTWFQAKGTLEELFNRIQANIEWHPFDKLKYRNLNTDIYNIYQNKQSALLWSKSTKEYVGTFGQIKSKLNNKLTSNHKTYVFEIDLNSLIESIKVSKHTTHAIKTYSYYPSVTRDISIKIIAGEDMKNIKKNILKSNQELIESIEIFNEYTKEVQNKKEKYIGLRITYRAFNRTLNHKDLTEIDYQINEIIQTYF